MGSGLTIPAPVVICTGQLARHWHAGEHPVQIRGCVWCCVLNARWSNG